MSQHIDWREDPHDLRNPRRLFLINKKYRTPEGLSSAEENELAGLQATFEDALDAVRPLPTKMLDEIERLVEQVETQED